MPDSGTQLIWAAILHLCDIAQRIGEHVDRLRAHDRVFAVEDEAGHTGHTHAACHFDFIAHSVLVGIRREQGGDDMAVKTRLRRDVEQNGVIADIAALFEICLE